MTALTVACLADLHLNPDCVDTVLDTIPETYDQIAAEATEIGSAKPDVCVVFGDVLQETTPETDVDILDRVATVLDSLPVPTRVIPGNHDVVHCSPAEFATHLGDHVPDSDGWWVDTERNLVFLNSAAPRLADSRGELTDPQQTRLREQLPSLDNPLVFCHHPLKSIDLSSNPWFQSYPEEAFCGRRRPVMNDLYGDTTSAIVTGHLHEHHAGSRHGTPHIVVDAYNKSAGHGQNGAYAVLTRQPDGTVTGSHIAGDGRRTQL
jgi:3',5'-cyclic AMP phosphodiesterase CpdA